MQSTSSLLGSPQGTSTNLQSPEDTIGSPNHNTPGTTPARKISKRYTHLITGQSYKYHMLHVHVVYVGFST